MSHKDAAPLQHARAHKSTNTDAFPSIKVRRIYQHKCVSRSSTKYVRICTAVLVNASLRYTYSDVFGGASQTQLLIYPHVLPKAEEMQTHSLTDECDMTDETEHTHEYAH